VEIVSTEAGKLVQRFQQLYSSLASLHTDRIDVSCIGWALNFIDVASVKEKTSTNGTNRHAQNDTSNGLSSDDWDKKKTASSLDDFLERVPDAGKVEIPLDLPDQLSRLDICASFPRPALLMVLPPGAYKGGDHSDAELFSSQVSLDAALSTNTSHSVNGLEALMLAQDDGHIRLVFYDVLSIGYISLPESWKLEKVKYKGCAWNAFSSTYMFLMEYTEEAGKTKTALVPLSLRFLRSSGSQLHLIESKTAQLHTLVNYVGEAIIALGYHWDHAKELPTKFMDNINEELAREGFEDGLASKYKSKDPNLVQSLFHLAATGYCPPTLKEWLVDILAERGHKRWDHSIMNGYAKVRELVHTSILPALDRCAAILTHLRGLAIYHENSPIFNVPSPTFDSILEIIRCMRLLAHHVLLYYSEESRQFTTFSTWLRREIDTQASQTPPNPNEEAEQDLNIDFSLLLTYIQGALSESRLDKFVAVTYAADQINVAAGKYDECQRALENFKNGEETDNQLLRMSMHYQRWLRLNSEVLDQVTAHQRASSTFSDGIILQEGTVLVSDVDMYEEKGDDMVTTMTAMVLKDMRHQSRCCLPLLINMNANVEYSPFVLHHARCRLREQRLNHSDLLRDNWASTKSRDLRSQDH
jgi:anaphase-promoting complex subunit 4